MLTREQVLEILRSEYPSLSTEFGVSKIGIFGSFAKGLAKESSDIDIIVEFNHPIGLKFVALVEHLENLLRRKVDVLTPAGIQAIRMKKVAKGILESIVYA